MVVPEGRCPKILWKNTLKHSWAPFRGHCLGHHLGHRLGRGRRLAGVHCHGDEPARLFGQARAARLRRRLRGFCEGAVASSSFLGAEVLFEELVELFVVVPTEVEGGLLLSVLAEDLQVWVVVEDPLD